MAKPDPRAAFRRRFFGTAPLIGTWQMDDVTIGSVRIDPFVPNRIVELHSDALSCHLVAAQSFPTAVSSPLVVSGLKNCEMVLEDYASLSGVCRRSLPDDPPKGNFVGSCRSSRGLTEQNAPPLEAIGLMVAIVELLVRPVYMRIDAS
jgi:hypothetical protein